VDPAVPDGFDRFGEVDQLARGFWVGIRAAICEFPRALFLAVAGAGVSGSDLGRNRSDPAGAFCRVLSDNARSTTHAAKCALAVPWPDRQRQVDHWV
jgi:hypothetical protein